MMRFTWIAAVALPLASCHHCLAAACPIGVAFTVTVTSSTSGAPVLGASATGDPYGDAQCTDAPGSTCTMFGYAGKYTVTVGAPGYQSVQRIVNVEDDGAPCCSLAVPGHLDVALVPVT